MKRTLRKALPWTIAALIYFGSFVFDYYWFNKAFSKGGCWENIEPDAMTIFLTVVPVVNTIAAIEFPIFESTNDNKFASKFFNVKK